MIVFHAIYFSRSAGQVLTVPLATLAPVQTIHLQSKEDSDIERDKQEIYRYPSSLPNNLLVEHHEEKGCEKNVENLKMHRPCTAQKNCRLAKIQAFVDSILNVFCI